MRFSKRIVFLIAALSFFCASPSFVFANNLVVQNVSLEARRQVSGSLNDPTILVEFDISWDNSFRNTENYDAAWIIFKASIAAGATLAHCTTYSNTSGRNLGNSTGSDQDLEFIFPSDGKGVFIQRKATGAGTVTSTDVRVSISCSSAATTQSIAIKVIGIEMVYIPEGPFYMGDGGASVAGLRKSDAFADPWFIESESTITTTNVPTGSYRYSSAANTNESASAAVFSIPSYFPKGYAAFYAMKYPITEGQWVEFFNNIGTTAQSTRDITAAFGKASDSVIKRNTVAWSGSGSATTTRSDRAANYLWWPDVAAYLDWVALRPMSELEFEKIARGPVYSVPGEYAWGDSSNITSGITFSGSPEDGNEAFVAVNTANTVYDSATYSAGDSYLGAQYQQGPVRPGIFATTSSDRDRAGAGYYGVMDLSGNLIEQVVTIGNTWGRIFYGVNGDGSINTAGDGGQGYARQLGWPGTHVYGAYGVQGADGSGQRAGAYTSASTLLRTSDRTSAAAAVAGRIPTSGGRGVRSISPPSLPTCNNSVIEAPEQCDPPDGDCNSSCESVTTPGT